MKSPVHSASRRAGFLLILPLLLLEGISLLDGARSDRKAVSPASPGGHFLIRLRPARPGAAATEEEKGRISRHFDYLRELQAGGRVLMAGIATDDYEEIVVVQVSDRLEAEKIMVSDPAVSGDVFLSELHPFKVVFAGAAR